MPNGRVTTLPRGAPTLFLLGFVLALAIRLLVLWQFPGNYDTRSWEEVVGLFEHGGELYRDTDRYNSSPAWSLLLQVAAALAKAIGSDLRFSVGLVLLLFDGLTAATLYRIAASRWGPFRGLSASLLFFLNPVSISISSAHGQFDGVSVFFLTLAVLFASGRVKRPGATLVSLSASVLAKHMTWFHPILFTLKGKLGRPRVLTVLVPYLVFGLSFVPYLRFWRDIRADVFEYRGLRSFYGIDALLLIPGVPDWLATAILAIAAAAALILLRRVEIARASLLLFLTVLVFSPGIGRQYFVWPIALGSLFGGPGYFVYTAVSAASIFQLARPAGEDIAFGPGWYGPWWAAIGWLLWEVRELRGLRSAGAKSPAEKSLRSPP